MQIVIDIPEKMYKTVQDGTYCGTLYENLKNGTPLPKGHGRLIDADELMNRMKEYGWRHPDSTVHEFIEDEAPTIIEADKGV